MFLTGKSPSVALVRSRYCLRMNISIQLIAVKVTKYSPSGFLILYFLLIAGFIDESKNIMDQNKDLITVIVQHPYKMMAQVLLTHYQTPRLAPEGVFALCIFLQYFYVIVV